MILCPVCRTEVGVGWDEDAEWCACGRLLIGQDIWVFRTSTSGRGREMRVQKDRSLLLRISSDQRLKPVLAQDREAIVEEVLQEAIADSVLQS